MSAPINEHAYDSEQFVMKTESINTVSQRKDPSDCIVTELNVSVLSKSGKTSLEKSKIYNSRLAPVREAVLNTLYSLVSQRTEPIHCLDAVAGTGIAGIQWKKWLKSKVHVTLAEKEQISEVLSNCERNHVPNSPLPLDFSRVPGDPMLSQGDDDVHTSQCTALVLLNMEAFDFVYLHPHSNIVGHVDAALTNLRNEGVMCLVASDSTHQFTRSANSIQRHFGASVTKTEYLKELAARVIIGSIARSAAKCNKGIQVLFATYVEDFFLVAVKVLRGPKMADGCMNHLQSLLHCQMCEERAFYPNKSAPIEHPYQLLHCQCQNITPGRTAIILGPMWSGELFSHDFLIKNLESAKEQIFSKKIQIAWSTMLDEVQCVQCVATVESSESEIRDLEAPASKRPKLCSPSNSNSLKTSGSAFQDMPAFYYNILRRKWKGINVPKFPKLLNFLRDEGFRASRTHFDFGGIRTNARLHDIRNILSKYCQQK